MLILSHSDIVIFGFGLGLGLGFMQINRITSSLSLRHYYLYYEEWIILLVISGNFKPNTSYKA